MTDFPMDTLIFNKIVEVFNQTRRYVLLLFPLAFFIRIAFGFILLKVDSFIDILKDSLFLFLGLFFFTDILKMALQIPYFVSSELSFGEWRNINLGDGIFTKALKRIVDWIGIVSYWISFGFYVVIVSILGFFAGYILFFGTMFRAYGLLKVFFILLFTVALWPLLWHSINFAVYTIAVSDNALANNVIIGGASFAKVFIPLWLISKTSKFPVAQTLKKVSFTGGGLAYAGGNYAYSVLKNNTNNIQKEETNMEDTARNSEDFYISEKEGGLSFEEDQRDYIQKPEDFSINEKEEISSFEGDQRDYTQEPENFSINEKGSDSSFEGDQRDYTQEPEDFSINEKGSDSSFEGDQRDYIQEPEDFSIREKEVVLPSQESQENKSQSVLENLKDQSPVSTETANHVSNRSHIESDNNSTQNNISKETFINPQIKNEVKKDISQSILNEDKSQNLKHEVSIKDQKIFNEAIHRKDWIEEEENIAPRHHKNKDREL